MGSVPSAVRGAQGRCVLLRFALFSCGAGGNVGSWCCSGLGLGRVASGVDSGYYGCDVIGVVLSECRAFGLGLLPQGAQVVALLF